MWYEWLVFVHVAAVFAFLLAHGVSAGVVFRVRGERDVSALRSLLDLSARAQMVSYVSLLVLLAAGIGAALVGNWWASGWPWAALGVLIAVWLLMSLVSAPSLHRVRLAVGITRRGKTLNSAKDADVSAATTAVQPWPTVVVGSIGLLVLLWLMMFKPF